MNSRTPKGCDQEARQAFRTVPCWSFRPFTVHFGALCSLHSVFKQVAHADAATVFPEGGAFCLGRAHRPPRTAQASHGPPHPAPNSLGPCREAWIRLISPGLRGPPLRSLLLLNPRKLRGRDRYSRLYGLQPLRPALLPSPPHPTLQKVETRRLTPEKQQQEEVWQPVAEPESRPPPQRHVEGSWGTAGARRSQDFPRACVRPAGTLLPASSYHSDNLARQSRHHGDKGS